jgi:transposase
MKYVGVDLHKQIIVLCVVKVVGSKREVVARRKLACRDEAGVDDFFRSLGPFQVAVEATAAYEWFLKRIERWANRIVLVHPRKMRIIAESRRKSDRLDAQILAEFLAADELPEAWRPTPRVREHRALVRQRDYFRRRISGVKCRLRNVLAHYNADVANLFTRAGREHLAAVPLSVSDRFVAGQLQAELAAHLEQRQAVDQQLERFAAGASIAEREARAVLESVPCVGPVTIEVMLSELGDVRRFRSQNDVVQYAGLAPGLRQSAERCVNLGITKEGSRLLRWAMIELAWRLVGKTRRWGLLYEQLRARCGAKKAIVAVARRVLCVLVSLLKSGQRYCLASEAFAPTPAAHRRGKNQRPQVPPPDPHLLPTSLSPRKRKEPTNRNL